MKDHGGASDRHDQHEPHGQRPVQGHRGVEESDGHRHGSVLRDSTLNPLDYFPNQVTRMVRLTRIVKHDQLE